MKQTITVLYDLRADAIAAIEDLKNQGISENDISLVSNNENSYGEEVAKDAGTGAGIGAAIGGTGGLLAGLGLMAIPGVGPVVAAGWLVATATGAAAGAAAGGLAGGIIGAMTEAGVPSEDAEFFAEGVRRGGTLVSVRLNDKVSSQQVMTILGRHTFVDPTSRRRFYQDSGWTGYDASAQPYTRDQIASERSRYR
jgi:hypothetical protein